MVKFELEGKGGCDPRLVLVEGGTDYRDLWNYFAKIMSTDDSASISEHANQTCGRIISEYNKCPANEFLKLENNQIMFPYSLAKSEATVAYYSLLTAIRERYRVNMPLIIDGFGHNITKYTPSLAKLIAETASQALIFTTEPSFSIPIPKFLASDQMSSVYDTVKDSVMGNVYRLEEEGVSEYGPKF